MSCKHCHGTQIELLIDKSDPSGVWHLYPSRCRCTRLVSQSWPLLLLVVLMLCLGLALPIREGLK